MQATKLRKSHPELLTWLLKHFGAPDTTPVHNLLQNRFLDDNFCLQLVVHVVPDLPQQLTRAVAPELVRQGWRAILSSRISARYAEHSLPSKHDFDGPLPEKHLQHKAKVLRALASVIEKVVVECSHRKAAKDVEVVRPDTHGTIRIGPSWAPALSTSSAKFEVEGADVQFTASGSFCVRVNKPYPTYSSPQDPKSELTHYAFHRIFRVEVKPFVGDDYPVILRSMVAKRCNLLLVERFEADGASWEQLVKVFASRDIRVARLEDVLVTEISASTRALPLPVVDTVRMLEDAHEALERFDESWVGRKRESQTRHG